MKNSIKPKHCVGIIAAMLLSMCISSQNSSSYDQNSANSGFGINGTDCAAFGWDALINQSLSGTYNTALGYRSLFIHVRGDHNTSLGAESLYNNGPSFFVQGHKNTAAGYQALYANEDGFENMAIGSQALYHNINGAYNTAIGIKALYETEFSSECTAVGYEALLDNGASGGGITGDYNTAMGHSSLKENNGGDYNTAFGADALEKNTDGIENTAIGYFANANNVAVTSNIGDRNTAVGVMAANTTAGDYNVAYGYKAMFSNNEAWENTAIGFNAMYSNDFTSVGGGQNVAVGFEADYNVIDKTGNVAVGYESMKNNTEGANTGVGYQSLYNNSGEFNSALGYKAGDYNSPGDGCTFMGANADVNGSYSNASAIGNGAISNANNKMWLGNSSLNNIESTMGVIQSSDGRFKFNVREDNVIGLEFIMKLRPVAYNFDTKKFTEFLTKPFEDEKRAEYFKQDFKENTEVRQTGFIAQEVLQAAVECGYDFNGVRKPQTEQDNYSINYALFVVPLVKAVQEQQLQIIKQKNTNEVLHEELTLIGAKTESIDKINLERAKLAEQSLNVFELIVAPNPFSIETEIKYTLPQKSKNVVIRICDMSGKSIKQMQLPEDTNKGAVKLNSEGLAPGTFIVMLIVEGKNLGSKQIILTK
jgi:hypothetical protein